MGLFDFRSEPVSERDTDIVEFAVRLRRGSQGMSLN